MSGACPKVWHHRQSGLAPEPSLSGDSSVPSVIVFSPLGVQMITSIRVSGALSPATAFTDALAGIAMNPVMTNCAINQRSAGTIAKCRMLRSVFTD